MTYPTIRKAVREMALDNGVRHDSIDSVMLALKGEFTFDDLQTAEDDLVALSNDDFEALTIGEVDLVAHKCHDITHDVLAFAFDEM